jgi:adenylate cyclase
MGLVAALLIIALELFVPRSLAYNPIQRYFTTLSVRLSDAPGCCLRSYLRLAGSRPSEAVAQHEYERSESLLANILPATIAERLKSNPRRIADSFSEATILFVDIVGFTKLSEAMTPEALVDLLNNVLFRDR